MRCRQVHLTPIVEEEVECLRCGREIPKSRWWKLCVNCRKRNESEYNMKRAPIIFGGHKRNILEYILMSETEYIEEN